MNEEKRKEDSVKLLNMEPGSGNVTFENEVKVEKLVTHTHYYLPDGWTILQRLRWLFLGLVPQVPFIGSFSFDITGTTKT